MTNIKKHQHQRIPRRARNHIENGEWRLWNVPVATARGTYTVTSGQRVRYWVLLVYCICKVDASNANKAHFIRDLFDKSNFNDLKEPDDFGELIFFNKFSNVHLFSGQS